MKKWIALLLALCLLLPCAAFCEGILDAADTMAENSEEEAAPTPFQIRYYFEHRLLPQLFYEDLDYLMDYIDQNGVYSLWTSFTESNGLDPVYDKEDFGQASLQREDGTRVLLVTMPVPEETPLCSRAYLCLNKDAGKKGYFTVEYDNFLGEDWFLCGWTEDNIHMDYAGASPLPDPSDPEYEAALNKEVNKVLELMNSDIRPAASGDSSAAGTGSGN